MRKQDVRLTSILGRIAGRQRWPRPDGSAKRHKTHKTHKTRVERLDESCPGSWLGADSGRAGAGPGAVVPDLICKARFPFSSRVCAVPGLGPPRQPPAGRSGQARQALQGRRGGRQGNRAAAIPSRRLRSRKMDSILSILNQGCCILHLPGLCPHVAGPFAVRRS